MKEKKKRSKKQTTKRLLKSKENWSSKKCEQFFLNFDNTKRKPLVTQSSRYVE